MPDFRELYEELLNYEGESPFRDVLMPWQDNAYRAMSVLKNFGEAWARSLLRDDIVDHLWDLYALSRVSDVLLLPFQKGNYDGSSWPGPSVTLEERDEYFGSLGMAPIEQKIFHPFFHEIVEVVQSPDPDEPISIDSVVWSGFMLGDLLFCRTGVRVRGGAGHIKKEIAESSKLYFTFWRKNRPVSDLSHGWGSNSQWRTRFRRDYQDDTSFYYNVDGEMDVTLPSTTDHPNSAREALTADERVELLVNRCFVLTDKSDEDLWPFDDTYVELRA
jgi:hypothetical protein